MNVATIGLLLAGALIAIYMTLTPAHPTGPAPSQVLHGKLRAGQPAPDFALKDLDGGTVRLADFRGHPLLLNVWATWCVPCRQEMPAIQRAYDREHGRGFDVLAVNMMESPSAIRDFMTTFKVTLPAAIDDGSFSRIYGVAVLPTSFFVDAQGVVDHVQVGEMNDALLQQRIDAMMRGHKVA